VKPIIHLQTKSGIALTKQTNIDINDFPFTLNTTIGCLYACCYCYLQNAPFKWHTDFGNEIKVKTWIPDKLDKELIKHKGLPQHLKRVQVNQATEGYLPQAVSKVRTELGRDLMKEVLNVFREHWKNGNKWMVHLVTKSHLVLEHLDIITGMNDQVQLEVSLTTLDENKARILEGKAPSVKKRLNVIRDFSDANIFVRVMCMPFIGNEKEARYFRDICFSYGAKAFKHKGMNYWDEDEILKGNLKKTGGRKDIIFKDQYVKSGEPKLNPDGSTKCVTVSMPDNKWKNFTPKSMTVVDSGYADCNSVDWGYVK